MLSEPKLSWVMTIPLSRVCQTRLAFVRGFVFLSQPCSHEDMDSSVVPLSRTPREQLVAVGSFAAIAVATASVFTITGWGLPCGLRILTGLQCPFCGGTRMAVDLLHGDLVGAWNHNALLVIAGLLLAVRTIGWIIEAVQRRHHSIRWLPYAITKHGLAICIVIAVVWTCLRNLP